MSPKDVLREARRLLVEKGWCQHFMCALNVLHITDWNDAPGRTKEEILSAFDAAIDLASEEERDA